MPPGPVCPTAPLASSLSYPDKVDYSATPIHALPNERQRDLRARTLSTLLSALRAVDPVSVKNLFHSSINPRLTATPEPLAGDLDPDFGVDGMGLATTANTSDEHAAGDKASRWLKHLNCVARLLVREHETVAVLPKRSGPDAHLSMVVATDSSKHRSRHRRKTTPKHNPQNRAPSCQHDGICIRI